MTKPTLLQTILGRPSQTYSFPVDKSYHSSRQDFVRAATAAPSAGHSAQKYEPFLGRSHRPSNGVIPVPSSSRSSPPTIIPSPVFPPVLHPQDDDDSDNDIFFTPLSSPDPAMVAPLPDIHDAQSSSSSSSSDSAASYSTSPTSDDTHRLITPPPTPAHKSYKYTDREWSKEVRWLVPPSQPLAPKRRPEPVYYTDLPDLPEQPRPRHHHTRTSSGRVHTKSHMTALLEVDEDADVPPPTRTSSLSRPRTSVSRSNSLTASTRPSSRSSHIRATSFSSHSSRPVSRTVEIPAPLPAVPTPAHGYTTLILPRAAYTPSDPWQTLGGGRIDLAKDGRAQGTMGSIEIVAGLSRGKRSSRRRTRELSSALALSAHLPPPSFVRTSDVLVQVYAIGLEGLDKAIVEEKVFGDGKAAGFVPGRSVVGRVVECGWEVKGEVMNKGDWVVGMLDAKKCGGLAEFVLLDRHRAQRVPPPTLPTPTLFPSSLPPPVSASFPSLTLESFALLPLLGLPAHRAVRTYTASLPSTYSTDSPRGTAVVLRAQDGDGGLATLMLCGLGVRVLAHIDPLALGLPEPGPADDPLLLWGVADDARAARGNACFNEVCARLRRAGVAGICVGAPTAVLARLGDVSGDIDFVLDTVGGRGVWDAAQAVLSRSAPGRGDAQFTTVVGEGRAVPSAQDHWRAGVRSWRRGSASPSLSESSSKSKSFSTDKPKDKDGVKRRKEKRRAVAYSWVSCVADVDFEGGDVRDALGAVLGLVEDGGVRIEDLIGGAVYGAGRVLPFERAQEAFGGAALEAGGTAVVRVVL